MADHGVVPRGSATDRAAALLALHTGSGFVLPNAWDAGSARVLEQVGFPAIATTSAGIAWACGVPDGAGSAATGCSSTSAPSWPRWTSR